MAPGECLQHCVTLGREPIPVFTEDSRYPVRRQSHAGRCSLTQPNARDEGRPPGRL
jgi:hypothetical protein